MIGRLRERIRFERPVIGDDGAGGGPLGWAPIAETPEVFAAVTATTGSEPVAADQRQAQVMWQVTIRARDDLSAEWRIVWRGQPLDILGILPEPRRAYLTLLARSGAGQ
ncbi:phage head closure protein [Zavarzinia compransoris]|uniref:phage head closure protein n=1 Tax=Zavarzinia compransoris TaxID=1264899 RepID=UPI0010D67E64|nr:phage head closure protein [Zavarzinia compransoris]TDP49160.1 SPP1 family predicted phage head-tail adaptor [Zavarzinia compransoris]